jgi:nitronate monooxygenase
MWKTNRVTKRFRLDVPLVQGPMGGGYSTPELAARVSEAGALGSLGAYTLSPSELRAAVIALRERTARTFAVNLWVPRADEDRAPPDSDTWKGALAKTNAFRSELGLPASAAPERAAKLFEAQVEVLLELAPPVFSFTFGVPSADVLSAFRARGTALVGTATNVAEARALAAAGVDAIVASGADAGGHRGLFIGELPDALIGTMSLVPLICDAVSVPVIAAGGITDGRGIAAALTLGADAVQLGTAFIAAEQSGASEEHRAALVGEAGFHTYITRAFSGRPGRALRNRLVEELEADPARILPFPYQNALTMPIRRAAVAAARTDLQSLWAGQAAPLAQRGSTEQVLQRLIEQTERAFTRLTSK